MIESYGIINDLAPHIVADFFEIVAYCEKREISRSDIETYLTRDGGASLIEGVEEEAEADGAGEASSAEKNGRFQKLSEEVFRHFAFRKAALGDWYPFSPDKDVLTPEDAWSKRHMIYWALLCYSRLRMFSKSNRSIFANQFEKLGLEAIRGLFPGWEIIHFGKGGTHRPAFGNKLKKALPVLARKLKDAPMTDYINELSEQNTGDAGIDLIALNTFEDPAQGVTVFFGQCAAQQLAWPEKRFESHAVSLSKYFQFFHQPGTLMIIPVLYRNPDGKWVDSAGYGNIVLDRLRLIRLLQVQGSEDALDAAIATIPAALVTPTVAAGVV